jgi:16S rRNA (guanine(966)-N(2))-methyltransferase RsmD
MRVISGKKRGKKLIEFAGGDIRPITDMAKAAMFNILFDSITDSKFLDLYAGTGAVGIEAISRGASHCVFVDSSREAAKIISKNLELTGFSDSAGIIIADCKTALEKIKGRFHFIFIDPPFFDKIDNEVFEIIQRRDLLIGGGRLILKHFEKVKPPDCFDKIKLCDSRRYGNSMLSFYSAAVISASVRDGEDGKKEKEKGKEEQEERENTKGTQI